MRIWLVPFRELDARRLLGQHREIHALWALMVKNGRPWERNWSKPEHRWALWDVHERTVEEMNRRGFASGHDHQSPIPKPRTRPKSFPTTRELLQRDRWALLCRWGGSYKGRGRMPAQYLSLLTKYRREGCSHDGAVERLGDKELCLICKSVVRDRGGRRWRRRATR